MTSLERIEHAIAELSASDVKKLAQWFDDFHQAQWDQQIESDSALGKLDKMAAKALASHEADQTTEL